jgi:CRP-like cAMP-binding protein
MFIFGSGSKEERRRRKLIDDLDRAQQKRRFDKALEHLTELIKLERRNPRWHHKRGDLLRRIGDEEEAIDAYDRAVVLYADKGLLARAVAVAKTILVLDPDRIDALERVDPQAARLVHRQQRPFATQADPGPQGARPSIFERATELTPAPDSPGDEVRFSEPRTSVSVQFVFSGLEFTDREAGPAEPSASQEPPGVEQLAKMPFFPLFAEVPKAALVQMAAGSDRVDLEDGDKVISQGDPADALFGIVEGGVKVLVPGLGEQHPITLVEGDVFGESCLLEDEARKAEVVVDGKLVALRIPKKVLDTLVSASPRIGELLLEMLARRLLANLLHGSPLFLEFDAAAKHELARAFEIHRVAAGVNLLEKGKKSDGLYVNLTGRVEIAGPEPERTAPAGPGTMFGQSSLLSRAASQVTVRALTDMLVLRLSATAFSQVAMQYPAMLARVAELSSPGQVSS